MILVPLGVMMALTSLAVVLPAAFSEGAALSAAGIAATNGEVNILIFVLMAVIVIVISLLWWLFARRKKKK